MPESRGTRGLLDTSVVIDLERIDTATALAEGIPPTRATRTTSEAWASFWTYACWTLKSSGALPHAAPRVKGGHLRVVLNWTEELKRTLAKAANP